MCFSIFLPRLLLCIVFSRDRFHMGLVNQRFLPNFMSVWQSDSINWKILLVVQACLCKQGHFLFPAIYSSHFVVGFYFLAIWKLLSWMSGKSFFRNNIIPIPGENLNLKQASWNYPPSQKYSFWFFDLGEGLRESRIGNFSLEMKYPRKMK